MLSNIELAFAPAFLVNRKQWPRGSDCLGCHAAMSNSPVLHKEMEQSPSPLQSHPPGLPSTPVRNETPSEIHNEGSSPPSRSLNSQTPPSTAALHARPGTPDFFLANSSYSMPGAYPITRNQTPLPSPQVIDPRAQPAATSAPYTPDSELRPARRRGESTSSIRNLLASLRRPSGRDQPRLSDGSLEETPTKRPATPSGDSMASSTKPLRKKMSGTFWSRRKSSLGTELMMDTGGQEQGQNDNSIPRTPVTDQNGYSTSPQAQQSPTSLKDRSEGGSIMNSIRKRKSGSFWSKRKSSMGLESNPNTSPSAVGSEEIFHGHARVISTASGPSSTDQSPPQPLRKKKSASFWKRKPSINRDRETSQQNSNGFAPSPTQPIKESMECGSDVRMSEAESFSPVQRTASPPPVLPELDLQLGSYKGGGFLSDNSEDMFANIGKD